MKDWNHEYYLNECLRLADESDCELVHFGSMIVGSGSIGNPVILGAGYNKKTIPHSCLKPVKYILGSNPSLCYAIHSEWMSIWNAIENDYKRGHQYWKNSVLYIAAKNPNGEIKEWTGFPCTICVRCLRYMGINKIIALQGPDKITVMTIEEAWKSAYGLE